jgi:hypothetical protein
VSVADYYSLIARAVAVLDTNTAEVRRSLYARASTAQVMRLRRIYPALTEAEITVERLALEEAINTIEAETASANDKDSPPLAGQPRHLGAQSAPDDTDRPDKETNITQVDQVSNQFKQLSLNVVPQPHPHELEHSRHEAVRSAARTLNETFDHPVPTWEEFKWASREKCVRYNTILAFRSMRWSATPRNLTTWTVFMAAASLVVVPIAAVLYFFAGFGGWLILTSIVLAAKLFDIAQQSACTAMMMSAVQNKDLYETFILRGALQFQPSDVVAEGVGRQLGGRSTNKTIT